MNVDWILWLVAWGLAGVPVGGLLLDRLLDVPARRYFAVLGPPWLLGTAGLFAYSGFTEHAIGRLVLWGAVGGVVGTVALDAVRLVGVRIGAFPLDMPRMFGLIAAGLAPLMQRQMIARMVEDLAELPAEQRRAMLRPRLEAMARLAPERRGVVVAGMLTGLERLAEERRQAVLGTQLALLAELPVAQRRTVVATMDAAMARRDGTTYLQPRGMPQLPMAQFRAMAAVAMSRTLAAAGVPPARIMLLGYG